MTDLTATGRVILGMLRLGHRTGYEIKSVVDVSTRHFWAASYGQIYPELKRLEADGLIVGEEEPAGGRARTAYTLTPAGEAALTAWLTSADDLTFELRDEGLLKYFFADALEPAQVAEHLRAVRERHERVLARLRQMEAGAEALDARHPYLTLQFGIEFHRWIAERFARMEQELTSSATPRRK